MSVKKTLTNRWLKIPFFVWLMALAIALVGAAIIGFFFIRRGIVEYYPERHFSVSDPAFFGSAHALGDPLPIGGNKITLLNNGDEIFPALLEAIRSAKKSINFEAYIFQSGTVGDQFRDALCERARAGLHVCVLLDGIGAGSKLNNSDVDLMKQAGCKFAYFHPTHSWSFQRLNRRSHRRILVVDGTVGFTGGVGFADVWQGNGDSENHWRDLHARIEGPLVAKLQGAFQQHWIKTGKEVLSGPDEFPALPPVGKLQAQVTASHSFSVAAVPLIQGVSISSADKRVWITNAYCTPSDYQISLLLEAVKRGVDVELLLPGKHNDQPATKSAGRASYGKLLEGGVKIYEYEPAMIHSKTMVVDGLFSMFGSSNFDARSSAINEELDVTVYDPGFGQQMEKVFEADRAQAKPYTIEQFRQRSLWERTVEWLMIPFHSQI